MFRPDTHPDTPATLPDRELGIAAFLLLLAVVLAVAVVPAIA
jgi:hypothetical protein